MDDNVTAEAPRPGTSLNRPMTKGAQNQSIRPITRYFVTVRVCERVYAQL